MESGAIGIPILAGTCIVLALYWWFVARRQPSQTKLGEFPDEKDGV